MLLNEQVRNGSKGLVDYKSLIEHYSDTNRYIYVIENILNLL